MSGVDIRSEEPPGCGSVVLEASVPSRIDLKRDIIERVAAAIIERAWVDADDEQWLHLCLEEAIVNAMLHGNEGDWRLQVRVCLRVDDTRWVLVIEDQGEGFCAEDVPDPEDPESLLLEHGRGILLMSQWLDELTYYRGGSCAFLARTCAQHRPPTEQDDA